MKISISSDFTPQDTKFNSPKPHLLEHFFSYVIWHPVFRRAPSLDNIVSQSELTTQFSQPDNVNRRTTLKQLLGNQDSDQSLVGKVRSQVLLSNTRRVMICKFAILAYSRRVTPPNTSTKKDCNYDTSNVLHFLVFKAKHE